MYDSPGGVYDGLKTEEALTRAAKSQVGEPNGCRSVGLSGRAFLPVREPRKVKAVPESVRFADLLQFLVPIRFIEQAARCRIEIAVRRHIVEPVRVFAFHDPIPAKRVHGIRKSRHARGWTLQCVIINSRFKLRHHA